MGKREREVGFQVNCYNLFISRRKRVDKQGFDALISVLWRLGGFCGEERGREAGRARTKSALV